MKTASEVNKQWNDVRIELLGKYSPRTKGHLEALEWVLELD